MSKIVVTLPTGTAAQAFIDRELADLGGGRISEGIVNGVKVFRVYASESTRRQYFAREWRKKGLTGGVTCQKI